MKLLKLQTKTNCYPDMNIQGIAVTLMQDFEKAIGAPFGLDVIAFFKRGTMSWYGYDEQVEQLRRETTECLKKEPPMANRFREKLFAQAKIFLEFIAQLEKEDLKKIANEELWKKYEDYSNQYRAVCMWGEPLAHYTKEKLAEFLLAYLKTKSETPEDDLNLLCAPNYVSFTQREEIDLLKMAIELKKHPELREKLICEHTHNYFWIPYDYGVCIWDEAHFEKELDNIENPEEELRKKETYLAQLPKKQQQRMKELNIDPHHQELFEAQQTCAILMDYKKEVLTQGHYASRRLIEEIARRLSITTTQARLLLNKEVKEFLLTNTKPDTPLLDERYECGLVRILKNGEYSFISGHEAQAVLKKLEETEIGVSETVQGFAACKGRCTGMVRVITDARNIGEMKQGEILVAHMTSPDFTLGIKKAAAIITDEGGMTCHAAIVSRELNIPCIIGTKNATKVLKTGDVVTVDAENGVVKKQNRWMVSGEGMTERTKNRGPPTAPTIGDQEIYKKYTQKSAGNVLVLGVTPELRDAALENGLTVYSVDFDPKIITAFKPLVRHQNSQKDRVIEGNWLDMYYPAGFFSLVMGDASFANLSSKKETEKLAALLATTLKPGGYLVLRSWVSPKRKKSVTELTGLYRAKKRQFGEFFMDMRAVAYFENVYSKDTYQYDGKKTFDLFDEEYGRGNLTEAEHQRLMKYRTDIFNLVYPETEFVTLIEMHGFTLIEQYSDPAYSWTDYLKMFVFQKK